MAEPLAIFAFAHDEELLIRDWILYHGRIAGFHNLHVVDNGSTDATASILAEFAADGLNAYRHGSYEDRHLVLSALMRRHRGRARLLVPLDIDEFIAVREAARDGTRRYDADPDAVRGLFDGLAPGGDMYEFSHSLHSIERRHRYDDPLTEIVSFFESRSEHWSKVFFPSRTFVAADGGNHGGELSSGSRRKVPTGLCLFHFHYLGYDETRRRAENICRKRGYDLDDGRAMAALVEEQVSSFHRLHYILLYRSMEDARRAGSPLEVGKDVVSFGGIRDRVLENRAARRAPE